MARTIIKGNKELAKALGVSKNTVCTWRKEGVLTQATLADFRRTIIYDFEKVLECLNHRPVKQGRRAAI